MPATNKTDPFAALPDTSVKVDNYNPAAPMPAAGNTDPFAHLPDTSPMEDNPANEGTYWMRDKSGKQTKIAYSRVPRATKAGYQLVDTKSYLGDLSHDPKLTKRGVLVVGLNADNAPIFAPVEGPESGAWGRFGSSMWQQVKSVPQGVYRAFADKPQDAGEAEFLNQPGNTRADLALRRLLIQPQVAQGKKAYEAWKQVKNPVSSLATLMTYGPSDDPDDDVNRASLALGHTIAAALPGIGPMWAGIAEKAGQQAGMGDWAGAAGSVAGGAAVEEAPKVFGKAMRSEYVTRKLPKGSINRMIRTGAGDVKFGKDPAEGILSEGITGNSLKSVSDQVSQRLKTVGQRIDTLAQSQAYAGKTVDTASALQPLDEAIAKAAKEGPDALYERLKEAKHDITSEWTQTPNPKAVGGMERTRVGPKNMTMSPYDALKFKRLVGDRVKWDASLPYQDDVNKAMAKVYGAVDDKLDATLGKEFENLNQTYSNLVGAAKALQRRIPVAERNANWNLSDIALAGTGHLPIAVVRKIAMYPAIRTRWTRGAYRMQDFPRVRGAGAVASAAAASQPQQLDEKYWRQYPQFREKEAADTPAAAAADDGRDPFATLADTSDQNLFNRAATAYDLDPNLIYAVMGQESGGKSGAVSVSGATGLMQLMPDTARKYGVTDATDPEQNVMGGAHYLRDLLDRHNGNVAEALKDYYGRGTPPPGFPSTDEYAQSVLRRYDSFSQPPPEPAPLPVVRAEAAKRKPSPMIPAPPTPVPIPNATPEEVAKAQAMLGMRKTYSYTATGPNNHKIGSDDGVTWFDIQSGQQIGQ